MDPGLPTAEDSGMARHLQVVRDDPEEGSAYVVARSEHATAGAAFVLAQCADRAVAAVFALAGQEVHGRDEMERDPGLARALAAWDAGDHGLFERERTARAAFTGPDERERMRPVGRHPSLLGKTKLS